MISVATSAWQMALQGNTWEQIVADAKAKGGNDHIIAMKTWKAAGIQARWMPYSGHSRQAKEL